MKLSDYFAHIILTGMMSVAVYHLLNLDNLIDFYYLVPFLLGMILRTIFFIVGEKK